MAKKYQKAAAARARAHRHKPKPSIGNPPVESIRELPPVETSIDGFGNPGTDFIDVNREYDCEYEGVNRKDSVAGNQPGSSNSDKLSGDKLEQKLQQRRAEVATLTKPVLNPCSQIMDPRTTRQWLMAEKNRALGYNGQSERNKQRKNKDARDQEELRKQARTSTNPQISMMRAFFAPTTVPPQPRQQTAEPTPVLPAF